MIIGTLYYHDESKYEGDWRDDQRHGNGKFINSYGNIYTYKGEWKNDMKHGNGIIWYVSIGSITFSNKESYDGDWKENMIDGAGKD